MTEPAKRWITLNDSEDVVQLRSAHGWIYALTAGGPDRDDWKYADTYGEEMTFWVELHWISFSDLTRVCIFHWSQYIGEDYDVVLSNWDQIREQIKNMSDEEIIALPPVVDDVETLPAPSNQS